MRVRKAGGIFVLVVFFVLFIRVVTVGIMVSSNDYSESSNLDVEEQKLVQTELDKIVPPNEPTDDDLPASPINSQIDGVTEPAEEDVTVEKTKSPYKIARSLEDVQSIIETDDGTIPVTNIEVPEILNGSADGIIITEQDLDKALEALNDAYFMEGGYIIKNLVTSAIAGSLLPSSDNSESLALLDRYTEFGIYFDEDKKLWMHNDMPIGVLTDGLLAFVGFDIDPDESFLDDQIDLSNYAFLNVTYKRVDLIDSIVESTPEQAAKRIQAITEMGIDVISLLPDDETNQ